MDDTLTLDELCSLANVPRRTVRYYIQIGLLEGPEGETRGARYRPRHLERLLRIRKLAESGISLERIAEVLSGEPLPVPPRPLRPGDVRVRSHVFIDQGIELQIDPETAGLSQRELRQFLRAVMQSYQMIKKEET